jgi:hypothetical protein
MEASVEVRGMRRLRGAKRFLSVNIVVCGVLRPAGVIASCGE